MHQAVNPRLGPHGEGRKQSPCYDDIFGPQRRQRLARCWSQVAGSVEVILVHLMTFYVDIDALAGSGRCLYVLMIRND